VGKDMNQLNLMKVTNLSLNLLKENTMEIAGVEVYLHIFLPPAVNGVELLVSNSDLLIPLLVNYTSVHAATTHSKQYIEMLLTPLETSWRAIVFV
jgi:hypothetical protein